MLRRLAFLAALIGACAAPPTDEPPPAAADGAARALLREAVGILRARALGGERVDWEAFLAHQEPGLPVEAPAAAAHPVIALAVAQLADPHAIFAPAAPPSTPPAPAVASEPAAEPVAPAPPPSAPPPIPAWPEGHWREDGLAYVLLPPCFGSDAATLQAYATALHGTILELAALQPRGWLVDLRLNGGGNVWPMLLGLRPLLGDGAHAGSMDDSGRWTVGVTGNAAWLRGARDAAPIEQLRFAAPVADLQVAAAPIAVLTGEWTMSSGEMVALAFVGLPGTRRFGAPTAGLTTATEPFALSDGSTLSLPTSWMTDRTGWAPRGPLAPQEAVAWGDWPRSADAAVARAAAWLLQTTD